MNPQEKKQAFEEMRKSLEEVKQQFGENSLTYRVAKAAAAEEWRKIREGKA
jgi:hypothetical protein